jgi:hypothetical protein
MKDTSPIRRWTRADQEIALETIERTGVNLTEWEETFVKSLRRQLSLGRPFTEKQIPILERIYAEKTP